MELALAIIGTIGSLLLLLRWLLRRAAVAAVAQAAEKIEAEIRHRAALERETVDQATAREVGAATTRSDADLEREINR